MRAGGHRRRRIIGTGHPNLRAILHILKFYSMTPFSVRLRRFVHALSLVCADSAPPSARRCARVRNTHREASCTRREVTLRGTSQLESEAETTTSTMPDPEHGHTHRASTEPLSGTATTGEGQASDDDALAGGIDATSGFGLESNLDPGPFDCDSFPTGFGHDFGDDEELPADAAGEHALGVSEASGDLGELGVDLSPFAPLLSMLDATESEPSPDDRPFTPTEGVEAAHALELRAESMLHYAARGAQRAGEMDRIEVGHGDDNRDVVAGRDQVEIEGTLEEHSGHGVVHVADEVEMNVGGPLRMHARLEDNIIMAGTMTDEWKGGTLVTAAMSDDMAAGAGVRCTAPLDVWVHGLAGMEERPGTCAADGLLFELAGTLYEREYGPSMHGAVVARLQGTVATTMKTGFRPLMKTALGVRNLISGGGGPGSGETDRHPQRDVRARGIRAGPALRGGGPYRGVRGHGTRVAAPAHRSRHRCRKAPKLVRGSEAGGGTGGVRSADPRRREAELELDARLLRPVDQGARRGHESPRGVERADRLHPDHQGRSVLRDGAGGTRGRGRRRRRGLCPRPPPARMPRTSSTSSSGSRMASCRRSPIRSSSEAPKRRVSTPSPRPFARASRRTTPFSDPTRCARSPAATSPGPCPRRTSPTAPPMSTRSAIGASRAACLRPARRRSNGRRPVSPKGTPPGMPQGTPQGQTAHRTPASTPPGPRSAEGGLSSSQYRAMVDMISDLGDRCRRTRWHMHGWRRQRLLQLIEMLDWATAVV